MITGIQKVDKFMYVILFIFYKNKTPKSNAKQIIVVRTHARSYVLVHTTQQSLIFMEHVI